uniref:Phytosulfokine n=1 Tax=Cicer arietinum TaxID=3827 RepID=A0A1S2XD81_CICAR|nr:putative phytosulfokines 6 isoform X1 [Cicer arietinum]
MNMKLSFIFRTQLVFLFFLLSSSIILSTRPLTSKQGENVKFDKITGEDFVFELEGDESLKLLGLEKCIIEDEECVTRRMTLEAHLDYIYTQHHKP